jgi:hypothetical protein
MATRMTNFLAPIPCLCAQFQQLTTDFQYNLQLLAERDAELQTLEADNATQATALAAKEQQLAELRASYEDTYSGESMWSLARCRRCFLRC